MKKITVFILALTLVFSVISVPFTVSAKTQAEIEAEIAQKDKEMNDLQIRIEKLNTDLKNAKSEEAQLEKDIKNLKADITELNNQIAPLEKSISTLEGQIGELAVQIDGYKKDEAFLLEKIEETKNALENAQTLYDSEREKLKDTIRATYESGVFEPINGISIFLNASSLSDFLAKADAVKSITDATKDAMNDFKQIAEDNTAKKNELEKSKEQLQEVIFSLEKDTNEYNESLSRLEADKDELESKKSDLQKNQKSLNSKLDKNESLQKEISKTLTALEKDRAAYRQEILKLEAELDALAQGSGGAGAEKEFIWPLAKKFVITSYFKDPEYYEVFGVQHYALDIAGSGAKGAEIYAAKSGKVTKSAYQKGGAGNYVMIDHGNNEVTVYYHMLETPLVKAGDYVKQGQIIGYVGSTGNSTGPHLHFGIKINNQWVDPLPLTKAHRDTLKK